MNYFLIFLIAISLSMDAFSLAISIGMLNSENKSIYILSMAVGLFHFFMPFLGSVLGNLFINSLSIDAHFLSGVIFFYIAILMFKDFSNQERENFKLSFIGILIFAFSVSMDSFGVGFALDVEESKKIISFLVFTGCSSFFTFIGLKFGKLLKSFIGHYSVLIGAIIMSFLAILNFCQFLF